MEKITSKNNQLVKDTKKLFTSPRARKESGAFVLEGARLCFDVLNSFYTVDKVFITQSAYDKYQTQADELIKKADVAYIITDEVATKLSDTVATQGIFAVCKMQNNSQAQVKGKVITLDNVQDPSNMGAVVRTAEALGIDAIITYQGCDIYNPKALRASMGSMLRVNIVDTDDLQSCLNQLKAQGFKVYSTVPDSSAQNITSVNFENDCICVIGNEANGVEENIKALSDGLITIPMLGRAESLNASVAASITMWEMLR